MTRKGIGCMATTPYTQNNALIKCHAKVHNPKDINKCLAFFRYTTATTLDCAISTGILRNSITWYVKELTDMGLLFVATIGKDAHTGRMAKHYSANIEKEVIP